MKKRTFLLAALIGALSIFASGCGFREDIVINGDGSSKITIETTMTEEELKDYELTPEDIIDLGFKKQTIDGKTCYIQSNTESLNARETKEGFTELTSNKMESYYGGSDISDMNSMLGDADVSDLSNMSVTINITFPKKVLKSNGVISEDGRTVSFDLAKVTFGKRLYAAMSYDAVNSRKE